MSERGDSAARRTPTGSVALEAGANLVKALALIAIAVIVGIVILQVTDQGDTGPISGSSNKSTTTSTSRPQSTSSTTANTQPLKSPDQLKVLVLNGGTAPAGSATTMRTALVAKGYTNQPAAGNDRTNATRVGNWVFCRAGLSREAAKLAAAVGNGTHIGAFPSPAPTGSAGQDCVVILGKPA